MSQSNRLGQVQGQQQVQTLSPQQILVVKLLELPSLELEERVRTELQDNPALEAVSPDDREQGDTDSSSEGEASAEDSDAYDSGDNEDFSLGDYLTEDDIPDYKLQQHNSSRDQKAEEIPIFAAASFYEKLKEQLSERNLTERQRQLAEYLIGSLDDDGLLRKSLEEITDELAIYMGIEVTEEDLEEVLRIIQDFEPPGLGARTLQECLLIQLRHHPQSEMRSIEEAILTRFYEEFTHKKWERIKQGLSLGEEPFREAIEDITRLNPRPGNALSETIGKSAWVIVPDFIVETLEDGVIQLSLNDYNMPHLRLSRDFSEMVEEHTKNRKNQSKESKAAFLFLKQKMDAAQGFIDAVKQRQQTLLTTMQAIIDIQRPFFEEGNESLLRPMILKDVADRTGLDISTISRVSNSKWVQTDYGIFPLKHFFVDGFTLQSGEEMSSREIRRILKENIDKEDKKNPLTDEELCEILKKQGYPIARRTVAKYRTQLNIPVARLRR